MVPDTSSKTQNKRRYTQSSSFKMAVLFTVLLGMAMLILGYFSYYFGRGYFVRDTEAAINAQIDNMRLWDSEGRLEYALTHMPGGRAAYVLMDESGAVVAGNIPNLPEELALLAEGTVVFSRPGGRIYAARLHTFDDGRTLMAGIDITETAHHYDRLQMLSFASIGFMILVIVTSFAISTFVVSRTNRIAQTAKDIMDTGDLSQRIVIDSRWDDLSYMATVLNALLARMEQLMQGVRQVSNNIAHDLRTPLTRLRNNLETLERTARLDGDEKASQAAEKMIEEADRLLSTFNALLRITRIEEGQEKHLFAPLMLDAVIRDVAELYEPLIEEKGVAFDINLMPVAVTGDRDLLFQLFANVLDNALKFTPQGGRVSVVTRVAGGQVEAMIADDGPGIRPEDRVRVFERFYRAEDSRHTPGNGLGLSLVAAVAALHGGAVRMEDNGPGLAVVLSVPLATA